MKCKPNKYQEAILGWAETGSGNALIEARAGCGKTSTLVMLSELITGKMNKKCLFLAFNKHIAEEIKEKLKPLVDKKIVEVRTMNSLGYSFIMSYLWKKHNGDCKKYSLDLNEKKMLQICAPLIDDELRRVEAEIEEDEKNDLYGEVLRLINLVRCIYVPYKDVDSIDKIIEKYRLFAFVRDCGIDLYKIVDEAIERDISLFENGYFDDKGIVHYMIDYVDQVYLPNVLNMIPPKVVYDFGNAFVLQDETQDTSNVQQRLLQKLTTPRNHPRYIMVADARQCIYSFAGADSQSVQHVKEKFELAHFPLNICYRCPKSHIRLIQTLVPDIEPNPDAIEGEIHNISNEDIIKYVQPGDLVIARKNKDLVDTIINLIEHGFPIYIKDENLVNNTLASIRRLQVKSVNKIEDEIYKLQKSFKQDQKDISKQNARSAITNEAFDIYEAVLILLKNFKKNNTSDKVIDFLKYISKILNTTQSKKNIIVSSVHGVKGGEADNVFVIDYNKFPYIDFTNSADQNLQEENLQYIAISRAKEKLYLCNNFSKDDND